MKQPRDPPPSYQGRAAGLTAELGCTGAPAKGRSALQEIMQEPEVKIKKMQQPILLPEYLQSWVPVEGITNCFLRFRYPNATEVPV